MDKPMPSFFFNIMAFFINLRNKINKPCDILKEAQIKPGYKILDYGTGQGGFSIASASLCGDSGEVYALDIHPLAGKRLKILAKKKRINNIKTICSDCNTGLNDNSIDLVLLYDIFHMFDSPHVILKELHRVLKIDCFLSFSDHHMKNKQIIKGITEEGLFKLERQDKCTYLFKKV